MATVIGTPLVATLAAAIGIAVAAHTIWECALETRQQRRNRRKFEAVLDSLQRTLRSHGPAVHDLSVLYRDFPPQVPAVIVPRRLLPALIALADAEILRRAIEEV